MRATFPFNELPSNAGADEAIFNDVSVLLANSNPGKIKVAARI